jgi:hypothetical protein
MSQHHIVQRALRLLTQPRERVETKEALRPQQTFDPTPPLQPSWRELAKLTAGLEHDDPRLSPVLSALAACEAHEKTGDRPGFEHAVERVRFLMHFVPGALVRWQGHEGHVLKVLGPARVEHVHVADNRLWVWTEWQGQGRWVPESVIAEIDGMTAGSSDGSTLSTISTAPRGGES